MSSYRFFFKLFSATGVDNTFVYIYIDNNRNYYSDHLLCPYHPFVGVFNFHNFLIETRQRTLKSPRTLEIHFGHERASTATVTRRSVEFDEFISKLHEIYR